MTHWQYFMLGIMAAFTPGMIVLAVLLARVPVDDEERRRG